jgi:transcriptional regulator with XRE-family HTH domain
MKKDGLKSIGRRIKEAREQCGYSQSELGHYLGLKAEEIQAVERGERALDLALFLELEGILNCSTSQLLGSKVEELSTDEAELLELYRQTPSGLPRSYVLSFLQSWSEKIKRSWDKAPPSRTTPPHQSSGFLK